MRTIREIADSRGRVVATRNGRCFEGGYVSSHRDGTTNRKLRGSSFRVVPLDPRSRVEKRERKRKRGGGAEAGGRRLSSTLNFLGIHVPFPLCRHHHRRSSFLIRSEAETHHPLPSRIVFIQHFHSQRSTPRFSGRKFRKKI